MKIPFLQDPAEEVFLMQRCFYFFTFTFKPLTIDIQLNGGHQAAVSEIPVLLAYLALLFNEPLSKVVPCVARPNYYSPQVSPNK